MLFFKRLFVYFFLVGSLFLPMSASAGWNVINNCNDGQDYNSCEGALCSGADPTPSWRQACASAQAAVTTAITPPSPIVAQSKANNDCPPGADKNAICLKNPLASGQTNVEDIIGIIIKAALGIVGALTLLMMVWGGFQWLTSAGNSEKIEAGSKTMLWAAIGVFLVFSSYLIISTFTNLLTGTN